MKKLVFLLIVMVALLALVTVACGGEEETTPTPTESPQATTTAEATASPEATAEPTSPAQPSGDLGSILGKASAIDSVRYEMAMTGTGVPSGTSKVWLKQQAQKMKTETTVQGQTSVLIVDWGTEVMYTYMPDQNLAMKMDLSTDPDATAPESPIEGSESIEGYNPTIVGTEVYDGKECLVVEYTVEGVQTKMWLWKQYGFPVKVVSTSPEGTVTIEYKNIDFSPIPDSAFELPAGVQIIEL